MLLGEWVGLTDTGDRDAVIGGRDRRGPVVAPVVRPVAIPNHLAIDDAPLRPIRVVIVGGERELPDWGSDSSGADRLEKGSVR